MVGLLARLIKSALGAEFLREGVCMDINIATNVVYAIVVGIVAIVLILRLL